LITQQLQGEYPPPNLSFASLRLRERFSFCKDMNSDSMNSVDELDELDELGDELG
jgi:hypothetical protein